MLIFTKQILNQKIAKSKIFSGKFLGSQKAFKIVLMRVTGLEPVLTRLEDECPIQLGYTRS